MEKLLDYLYLRRKNLLTSKTKLVAVTHTSNIVGSNNDIKKINAKNEKVTENQMSNMSNIHKSLLLTKHQSKDLIYFVEEN